MSSVLTGPPPTAAIPTPRASRESYEPPVVVIPASARTWDGFRAWALSDEFPKRCHISYIGGEIHVDMSPERLSGHSQLKSELSSVLHRIIRESKLGLFLPDRSLVSNQSADISNEPDAAFVSWLAIDSGRVRLTPTADGADYKEFVGTPDLVIEIVSPSSVGKDTRSLRQRYHAAGIPEYWLIDARGEEVVFELQRHRPDGYAAAPARDGWLTSAVFGREFRLTRTRVRPDIWEYVLDARPLGAGG